MLTRSFITFSILATASATAFALSKRGIAPSCSSFSAAVALRADCSMLSSVITSPLAAMFSAAWSMFCGCTPRAPNFPAAAATPFDEIRSCLLHCWGERSLAVPMLHISDGIVSSLYIYVPGTGRCGASSSLMRFAMAVWAVSTFVICKPLRAMKCKIPVLVELYRSSVAPVSWLMR